MNNTAQETYRRVETADIMDLVRTKLDERGIDYTLDIVRPNRAFYTDELGIRHSAQKSTKHLVKYTLTGLNVNIHGETLTPMIAFFNSYEKECAFSFAVGIFRSICENGMFFGDDFFSAKARHRTGPNIEKLLKTLEYQIVAALDQLEAVAEDVEEATSQTLETYEAVSIVGNLNVPKKVKDKVINDLLTGQARPEDTAHGNIWGLYQQVNEQRRLLSSSNWAAISSDPQILGDIIALAA